MSETTRSLSPVLDAAWRRFHATQEEMRALTEATPRFKDTPQHRAKAYHLLLEALAMAYNFAVAPRLHHPRIQKNTGWQTEFYTQGQNGPDLYYGVMMLDGRQAYRLRGKFNDSVLILYQVINYLSGHPDSKAIGNHDLSQFKIGPDGSFDIIVSGKKHDGDWIPLDPNSRYNFILCRRFTGDWNQTPAELTIDRISEIPDDYYDADEFDETAMAERIDRATDFVRYLFTDFNLGLYDFYLRTAGEKNKMTFLPGTVTSQVGSPSSNYAMTIFELQPDEALILELDRVPDGTYWSFQMGDVWSRSLIMTYRQTSVNMHHAAIDADGGVRMVVANQDPGVLNWLDTCGRQEGVIVFRNYRATSQPIPNTRKVKLAELPDVLPKGTKMISKADRATALRRRREGFLKLHGE